MASLNRVFLIGNLTRDPELRVTPKGTAIRQYTARMEAGPMSADAWVSKREGETQRGKRGLDSGAPSGRGEARAHSRRLRGYANNNFLHSKL